MNIPDHFQKLTIFLSHSHKDIEKVRKLRDILEFLDCEPLMFYLKCLDEDEDELDEFIMREIKARNIFIYCRSENAEQSAWVQKELSYIKSLDSKRLYTVDIDKGLVHSMLGVLEKIIRIVKGNQVFLSYTLQDGAELAQELRLQLSEKGYNVFHAADSIPAGAEYSERIEEVLNDVVENGVFVPIITPKHAGSAWCRKELEYVAARKGAVLPIVVGNAQMSPTVAYITANMQYIELEEPVSEEAVARIDHALRMLCIQ